MTRYQPAPYYLWSGTAAVVFAGLSGWMGWHRPVVFIPAILFLLSAMLLLLMAFRPAIAPVWL